mmetsp:Transcript_8969/g.15202  ORF Transcript_8969/g.15202 Transcript_8969/m.15202 type:complete len:129 (+) Transcript_8969:80-466(+)
MPRIGMNEGSSNSQSFGAVQQGDYELYADEEVDEITINWSKLIARIVSLFLVVCICVLSALGGIDTRFYALAGIVFVVSLIVFGMSFLDIDKCKTRTVNIFKMEGRGSYLMRGSKGSDKNSNQDALLP